jgi:hypothetical protein
MAACCILHRVCGMLHAECCMLHVRRATARDRERGQDFVPVYTQLQARARTRARTAGGAAYSCALAGQVLKVIEEELSKLSMMETSSSEFHVTRSYAHAPRPASEHRVLCRVAWHSARGNCVAGLPGSPACCGARSPHIGTGARRCHISTGRGRAAATSPPGVGSPLPHLPRDWAHPCHICAGTGWQVPRLAHEHAVGHVLAGLVRPRARAGCTRQGPLRSQRCQGPPPCLASLCARGVYVNRAAAG